METAAADVARQCPSLAPDKHITRNNSTLSSDVKRGQNLEAETEAKDKVMNKKYQTMVDNKQVNFI